MRALRLVLIVAGFALCACGGKVAVGKEGDACGPTQGCGENLACQGGVCVQVSTGAGGGNTGGGNGGTGGGSGGAAGGGSGGAAGGGAGGGSGGGAGGGSACGPCNMPPDACHAQV